MSTTEASLAQRWYREHVAPAEIARRLGRNKSTITRHVIKKVPRRAQGRPPALTEAQVDYLVVTLDKMIRARKAESVVTASMLRHATRTKACTRVIRKALAKRNIRFRPLREKPVLTEEDVAARFAFAKKYRHKTAAWWNDNVHAYIDAKYFHMYLDAAGRSRAAQHATRGAHRSPGKGLSGGYVKAKKSLKGSSGGCGNGLVVAAVGAGRVTMWHQVSNGRWSGAAAAKMYAGPLSRALQASWPLLGKWSVLEDNDPAGFKSIKGKAAKAASCIEPFVIPPRSPDLSVCDYALWKEVNKRMRRQEKHWAAGKKETRPAYMARLRRTAMRLPETFVRKSIGDMARRCQRLYKAQGCHFEEGGKGE